MYYMQKNGQDTIINNLNKVSPREYYISYVGNFLNHGYALAQYGTGLIYLISKSGKVKKIDALIPHKNKCELTDLKINKVELINTYNYKKPLSIINIIKKIKSENYNLIIFNINSTSFGEGNLSNFFGLISPLILKKVYKKNIIVIYHSSVITNDIEKLGYFSIYNKLRKLVLLYIEKSIFKNIDTFVTMNIYKKLIDKKINNNRVNVIQIKYLEAIPTLLLNNLDEKENLIKNNNRDLPRILLFGYWGPQKDLEFALEILSQLRDEGYTFYLTIAGGINNHFKNYKKKFNELIKKYKNIINEIMGYIDEKNILNLFTSSDLLLLSYAASGGLSGVLNVAIFFELSVIGIEFPEYKEQSERLDNVVLVRRKNFKDAIKEFLIKFNPKAEKSIDVKNKIESSITNVNKLFNLIDGEK